MFNKTVSVRKKIVKPIVSWWKMASTWNMFHVKSLVTRQDMSILMEHLIVSHDSGLSCSVYGLRVSSLFLLYVPASCLSNTRGAVHCVWVQVVYVFLWQCGVKQLYGGAVTPEWYTVDHMAFAQVTPLWHRFNQLGQVESLADRNKGAPIGVRTSVLTVVDQTP